MKIFYYCSTGTFVSLVAANYHLGIISNQNVDLQDICKLPNYNSLTRDEIGRPIFVGVDNMGHEIFTFGVKKEDVLLTTAMIDWLKTFNITDNVYKLVDMTSHDNNYWLRAGEFLSYGMDLKRLGGGIGAYGILKLLPMIFETVNKVKKELT